jgi:hypothetical protein
MTKHASTRKCIHWWNENSSPRPMRKNVTPGPAAAEPSRYVQMR